MSEPQMANTKKIHIVSLQAWHMKDYRVAPALIADALHRHQAGICMTMAKGQYVSFHRYGRKDLVVATREGGETFIMPHKAYRAYLAWSPEPKPVSRESSPACSDPKAPAKMDLGWWVGYHLSKDGLPRELVNDAASVHESGTCPQGGLTVSQHIYGDGTQITLVSQDKPRVTFVMTTEVYETRYKWNPLRLTEQDVQRLYEHRQRDYSHER
jgi:hypothetical protein